MWGRKFVRVGTASAGVALLAATPALATDGYFLNGVGAKAKGMGGVAIALPQDALSIVSNPAAGTFIGHRPDGGVEIFVPDRGAGIRGNAAGPDARFGGNGSNPFVLPEIGYVRPLSDRFAVGIAISGNGGMNTNYKANPFARFGATGPAGANLQQLFVSPTLSARIAPGHGIGIAPVIAVQSFRANGLQPFAAASADPQHFTDRGTSWSAGVGVRVGYLGQLTDWLSVGAFYQSKIATGRFGRYAGLFEDRGSFDIPASYGAGLAVKPVPALTIAADYKRIDYAGVGAVGNPLAPLFRGVPFGAAGGPGFGWRDVNVIKVGASVTASPRWQLRAGYGHSDNPVPPSQTFLNILAPGVVQDHVTLGATYTTRSGVEITGFAMHAPKRRVEGRGSIPASFGGGEADIHLGETSIGLSFGKRF